MGRRGREGLVLKWCRSHGTNDVLVISYSLDRAKASRESTMEAEEKSSELRVRFCGIVSAQFLKLATKTDSSSF